MSIATAITAAQGRVADCYTAISNKGGTLPATQNLANMPTAIGSIPTGGTIDSLTVTPTTSQQTITASGGVDGYSPITVNAVTSAIDSSIIASNIRNGVSILGVTGSYGGGGAVLTTKTITSNGVYNAYSDNADGYSSVTVDVSGGIIREVSQTGVYQAPSSSFTFELPSNATDLGERAFFYAFYKNSGLTSIDLSSLTSVSSSYGGAYCCYQCQNLTSVDLSSLENVTGANGLQNSFYQCQNLTSVDLSSLTSVSGNSGMNNIFYKCSGLTNIDLSSLEEISGSSGIGGLCHDCTSLISADLSSLKKISGSSGLNQGFMGCSNLTSVNLSSLEEISDSGLYQGFYNCTSIENVSFPSLYKLYNSSLSLAFYGDTSLKNVSFPALTTSSFNVRNAFSSMLSLTGNSVTHTLHFPSNLQSTISNLSGYPNFGGTSGYVTLAFDLPATS